MDRAQLLEKVENFRIELVRLGQGRDLRETAAATPVAAHVSLDLHQIDIRVIALMFEELEKEHDLL